MKASEVRSYLDRISADTPVRPGLDALRQLQRRHLLTVPFENLSIHLGEEVRLDEGGLIDKVVHRRRGGFCYELNGAFAALLRALGFEVTVLAARVFGGGRLGPVFDHATLRVDLEEPWLVDVGFGRFSQQPLRLATGDEQVDAAGHFQVLAAAEGDVDVLMDGELQYRVEARSRTLEDFGPTCWWQCTSPRSHFTQSLVCTLLTDTGRVTLSDRTLIETEGGRRTEQTLVADEDVLAAYRKKFGILLDRLPGRVLLDR